MKFNLIKITSTILLFIIVLLTFSGIGSSKANVDNDLFLTRTYQFELTKINDLDTITGNIDLGFGISLRDQKIRLLGINAPETSTSLGKKQKNQAKLIFKKNPPTHIITIPEKCKERGKFGRVLAFVYSGETLFNKEFLDMKGVEKYTSVTKKCKKIINKFLGD